MQDSHLRVVVDVLLGGQRLADLLRRGHVHALGPRDGLGLVEVPDALARRAELAVGRVLHHLRCLQALVHRVVQLLHQA